MATAVTSQQFRSEVSLQMWDHDPDTTAATVTTPDAGTTLRYVALGLYDRFFCAAMTTVVGGGSGMTLLEIVAATDSAGTSATVVLAGSSVVGDAQGDWTSLEVTAAQVKEVGDAASLVFTHVAARITCANSGTECAVVYVRGLAKFPQLNLTPVSTIS